MHAIPHPQQECSPGYLRFSIHIRILWFSVEIISHPSRPSIGIHICCAEKPQHSSDIYHTRTYMKTHKSKTRTAELAFCMGLGQRVLQVGLYSLDMGVQLPTDPVAHSLFCCLHNAPLQDWPTGGIIFYTSFQQEHGCQDIAPLQLHQTPCLQRQHSFIAGQQGTWTWEGNRG